MAKQKKAATTTRVEFRTKAGAEPVISMELTGAAAEIHKDPERLRAVMEMLQLPKGTVAKIIVSVSSAIVR
jgi:hypothetical protein